jgi:RimJ/RimL family protein N-acetyltransferase
MPQPYVRDTLGHQRLALTARDKCAGTIVGRASAAILTADICEVAVWVDDSWQRQGVGTTLARAVLRDLANRGVRKATSFIELGNLAVVGLIDKVAPDHTIRLADGLTVVEIPIESACAGES